MLQENVTRGIHLDNPLLQYAVTLSITRAKSHYTYQGHGADQWLCTISEPPLSFTYSTLHLYQFNKANVAITEE